MPTPANSRGENPSTYFVEERFSKDEFARLTIQEQMTTSRMGGVLPEQTDPADLRRILDVACGPGGWLITTAQTYPTISELVGVDVNTRQIAYARQQAERHKVSDRVQFRTMDVLRKLDFPADHFDLVNQRSATSYLRTWDWPKLLNDMRRITRVGGIVRLTEPYAMPESNGQAFNKTIDFIIDALYQSGHLFSPERSSISDRLPAMMSRYSFLNVQTRDYALEYRAGTPEGDLAFENTRIGLHTTLPTLRKWTRLPDDYEELSQQALLEMQQPGFKTNWLIRTIWGTVPTNTPAFGER